MLDPQKMKQSLHFEVRAGILYWVEDKKEEEKKRQILVPQKYWQDLLQVAHTLPMGGHLGRDKTEAWLKWWVFWPGLYKMVEKYCTKCPECQRTEGVKLVRVLLVPLLLVGRPFD